MWTSGWASGVGRDLLDRQRRFAWSSGLCVANCCFWCRACEKLTRNWSGFARRLCAYTRWMVHTWQAICYDTIQNRVNEGAVNGRRMIKTDDTTVLATSKQIVPTILKDLMWKSESYNKVTTWVLMERRPKSRLVTKDAQSKLSL